MAERQGLERDGSGFRVTPQAYRIFQGRLLERIFSNLLDSKTGKPTRVRARIDKDGMAAFSIVSTISGMA